MYRVTCVFLLVPLLSYGQAASAPTEWAAVERIAAGERIEVQLLDYKTLKGTFDHTTANVVYLQRAGKTIEARRDEVRRLWRRKHGHGGSGALIGGIAGAALLGVYGGTHMESGPNGEGLAAAAAGVTVIGALIGAGVGYGIGHGKLQLVYRAPRCPK